MTRFVDIETTGQSPAISKRAQGRVNRATNFAAGRFWDRRYLGLHFLPSAASRYRHKSRSRQTEAKKIRLAALGKVARGGRVDLVHSGLLESTVNRPHGIIATAKKSTVPIATPSYVSARVRTKRIDMVGEILTIIPKEETAINRESSDVHTAQTQTEIANNRYNHKA